MSLSNILESSGDGSGWFLKTCGTERIQVLKGVSLPQFWCGSSSSRFWTCGFCSLWSTIREAAGSPRKRIKLPGCWDKTLHVNVFRFCSSFYSAGTKSKNCDESFVILIHKVPRVFFTHFKPTLFENVPLFMMKYCLQSPLRKEKFHFEQLAHL